MMLSSEMLRLIAQWVTRDPKCVHYKEQLAKTSRSWTKAFMRFRSNQIKAENECCRKVRSLSCRLSHEERSTRQYAILIAHRTALSKSMSAFQIELRKLLKHQAVASYSLGRRKGFLRLNLHNNFIRTMQRERSRMCRRTGAV